MEQKCWKLVLKLRRNWEIGRFEDWEIGRFEDLEIGRFEDLEI
jgi:hypothetical protein